MAVSIFIACAAPSPNERTAFEMENLPPQCNSHLRTHSPFVRKSRHAIESVFAVIGRVDLLVDCDLARPPINNAGLAGSSPSPDTHVVS